jgi:hypothetical protein
MHVLLTVAAPLLLTISGSLTVDHIFGRYINATKSLEKIQAGTLEPEPDSFRVHSDVI